MCLMLEIMIYVAIKTSAFVDALQHLGQSGNVC